MTPNDPTHETDDSLLPADRSSLNVTLWVQAMEDGDEDATRHLFEHCFPRLLKYARRRIPDRLRRALDEEDVALSAFQSFCSIAKRGTLNDIDDRTSLWRMLMCITKRKSAELLRHESRKKRGGGSVRGESAFMDTGDAGHNGQRGIENVSGTEIDLELFQEQCCEALDQLENPDLKVIALLRMEGYSIDEIAERIPCAKRTVERRLQLIRATLSEP